MDSFAYKVFRLPLSVKLSSKCCGSSRSIGHQAGRRELERKGIIKKTRDYRKAKNRANKLYAEYKRREADFTCRSLGINLQNGLPCAVSNAHVKRAQVSLLISFHGELDQIIVKLAMIHEFLRNDSQALFGADVKNAREITRRASVNTCSSLATVLPELETAPQDAQILNSCKT